MDVIDMAGGRTLATVPLPAYYANREQVVVSADVPPGVLAVSGNEVFISPESHETDVVETYALNNLI